MSGVGRQPACAALLPASICMGGTLPALSQALIAHRSELPRSGALLYAVNTFGAAAGALAAGFWLPLLPGVRASYLAAMAGNVAIGLLALWFGRMQGSVPAPRSRAPASGAVTKIPSSYNTGCAAITLNRVGNGRVHINSPVAASTPNTCRREQLTNNRRPPTSIKMGDV